MTCLDGEHGGSYLDLPKMSSNKAELIINKESRTEINLDLGQKLYDTKDCYISTQFIWLIQCLQDNNLLYELGHV